MKKLKKIKVKPDNKVGITPPLDAERSKYLHFLDRVLLDVEEELQRAIQSNGTFNSVHEGYAVLLEEVDELWDEVKKKTKLRDVKNMERECIQIAAMAVRFIWDCVKNKQK